VRSSEGPQCRGARDGQASHLQGLEDPADEMRIRMLWTVLRT
jgi:hypothetical protein